LQQKNLAVEQLFESMGQCGFQSQIKHTCNHQIWELHFQ
jgi:hypothetical protein